ncbi:MAG: DUF4249 domain-containing protein [Bacteroidales bacterium]|jgi:hypothetical protein
MNKISYVFLFLIFLSCNKEIEIKIPEKKPKLVVNCTLVPFTLPMPKTLYFDIKSSTHIFDTTKNTTIKDAIVLLYSNGNFLDTIRYVDSVKNYPVKLSMYPVTGQNLNMKVIKDGYESVSASTTIPSKVIITDTSVTPIAYYDETGTVFSEIKITFTDPANEVNFYEIAVSNIAYSNFDDQTIYYNLTTADKIITSESYYPSLIRLDVNKPKYLLFNDKQINGQEHNLTIYYSPPQIEDTYRYISDHFISIHLRNVTEEYYKFKTTMIQQMYSRTEDILYGVGEPLNVFTNIQNGYGIFAGFNNDIISMHINKIKLDK